MQVMVLAPSTLCNPSQLPQSSSNQATSSPTWTWHNQVLIFHLHSSSSNHGMLLEISLKLLHSNNNNSSSLSSLNSPNSISVVLNSSSKLRVQICSQIWIRVHHKYRHSNNSSHKGSVISQERRMCGLRAADYLTWATWSLGTNRNLNQFIILWVVQTIMADQICWQAEMS
jgi:hypothetical protein